MQIRFDGKTALVTGAGSGIGEAIALDLAEAGATVIVADLKEDVAQKVADRIAAKGGHPTVIVPFGTVPNAPTPPLPAGFDAQPAPYGVSFTGVRCSEPRLLALDYSFEQARKRRMPPPLK